MKTIKINRMNNGLASWPGYASYCFIYRILDALYFNTEIKSILKNSILMVKMRRHCTKWIMTILL